MNSYQWCMASAAVFFVLSAVFGIYGVLNTFDSRWPNSGKVLIGLAVGFNVLMWVSLGGLVFFALGEIGGKG